MLLKKWKRTMGTIKVERLKIRLKGISEEKARELSSGLDTEIMQQLSNRTLFREMEGSFHINEITLGSIQSERKNSPSQWRKMIANRVADAVDLRSQNKNSKLSGE
jgi:hypothetical protein